MCYVFFKEHFQERKRRIKSVFTLSTITVPSLQHPIARSPQAVTATPVRRAVQTRAHASARVLTYAHISTGFPGLLMLVLLNRNQY